MDGKVAHELMSQVSQVKSSECLSFIFKCLGPTWPGELGGFSISVLASSQFSRVSFSSLSLPHLTITIHHLQQTMIRPYQHHCIGGQGIIP